MIIFKIIFMQFFLANKCLGDACCEIVLHLCCSLTTAFAFHQICIKGFFIKGRNLTVLAMTWLIDLANLWPRPQQVNFSALVNVKNSACDWLEISAAGDSDNGTIN